MTITIHQERPDTPDATKLILELDAHLKPMYPAENSYGYSIDKLIEQGVEFFVIRHQGEAAGCAGVQFFMDDEPPFGELKRMYVRDSFRGLGMAKQILQHLEEIVASRNVSLMRLETGTLQTAAIGLYEQSGYARIGPFADYVESELNIFYEKTLLHA